MDAICLRQATDDDLEFLWWLHRATLREYVAQTWGWDDQWQERRFRRGFEPDAIQIVLCQGSLVGSISVRYERSRVYIALIEIAPAYQRRGIGTHLVRQLSDDADLARVPMELHVLKVNPAKRLYERLGLEVIDETDTHYLMRRPATDPTEREQRPHVR